MRVKVVLFAGMREELGMDDCDLELEEGASVPDALAAFGKLAGRDISGMGFMTAVNRRYVLRTTVLSDGDEIALIPPVSGGQR